MVTRLTRLADGLDLLCARLRGEAADDGALFEKFGGSLTELLSLRQVIRTRVETGAGSNELDRLDRTLADLEGLIQNLPRRPSGLVISRPHERRRSRRGERLDASTLRLLQQAALVVGVAASAPLIGGNAIAAIVTCTGSTSTSCSTSVVWNMTIKVLPTVEKITAAYSHLLPQVELAQVVQNVFADLRFTDGLFSCGAEQAATGSCVWGRVERRSLDVDANSATNRLNEEVYAASLGLEKAFNGVRVGVAADYEDSELSVGRSAHSNGQRAQVGLVIKSQIEGFDIGLSATRGMGWFDTRRTLTVPVAATGISQQGLSFGTLSLRISRPLTMGRVWIRPGAEVLASTVQLNAVHETGLGPFGLVLPGQDNQFIRLRPSIELGTTFGDEDGVLFRPTVRVALNALVSGDGNVTASFAGATPAMGPMQVDAPFDDLMGELSVGFDLVWPGGTSFRFGYFGQLGEMTEQHAGSVKLVLPL